MYLMIYIYTYNVYINMCFNIRKSYILCNKQKASIKLLDVISMSLTDRNNLAFQEGMLSVLINAKNVSLTLTHWFMTEEKEKLVFNWDLVYEVIYMTLFAYHIGTYSMKSSDNWKSKRWVCQITFQKKKQGSYLTQITWKNLTLNAFIQI